MKKESIYKIVLWSTLALLIPFVGNIYVNGWNWGVGDFVFAWIFFILLGSTYTFVTKQISNSTYRILAGIVVVLVFASVWVMLATG